MHCLKLTVYFGLHACGSILCFPEYTICVHYCRAVNKDFTCLKLAVLASPYLYLSLKTGGVIIEYAVLFARLSVFIDSCVEKHGPVFLHTVLIWFESVSHIRTIKHFPFSISS